MPIALRRLAACAVLILATATGLSAQPAPRVPNGDFWLELSNGPRAESETMKSMVVFGVMVGLRAAPTLIVFTWANREGATREEYVERVTSLKTYIERFLQAWPSQQVVSGLDAFYGDYANRKIRIADGVVVILRRIAGDKDSAVDEWIASLRKSAAEK